MKVAVPGGREQAVVTLAYSPSGKTIIGQIIFKGCTSRSLPFAPQVAKLSVVAWESHWASTSTLASLVDDLEKHMCEKDNSATPPPWILLLDCAPVHLSAETTAMLRAHEQLHIVLIQRNSTGYNQPLDIAYFRSFKATLRRG
eukprot:5064293-Amphidinium_carterae.2